MFLPSKITMHPAGRRELQVTSNWSISDSRSGPCLVPTSCNIVRWPLAWRSETQFAGGFGKPSFALIWPDDWVPKFNNSLPLECSRPTTLNLPVFVERLTEIPCTSWGQKLGMAEAAIAIDHFRIDRLYQASACPHVTLASFLSTQAPQMFVARLWQLLFAAWVVFAASPTTNLVRRDGSNFVTAQNGKFMVNGKYVYPVLMPYLFKIRP